LSLKIPLPTLDEQNTLIDKYYGTIDSTVELEQEAANLENKGWRVFQEALGIAPPPPSSERTILVAHFKDMERWNHESVLRTTEGSSDVVTSMANMIRLGDVIKDIKVGWSPKCLGRPATAKEWGVLKLNAVTTGEFDDTANKALPKSMVPVPELEVKAGDVLITRGSGVTRLVGAAVYVESTRPGLMICDLMFRVVFLERSPLLGGSIENYRNTTTN